MTKFEQYMVSRRRVLNKRIDNYFEGHSKSDYGASFAMLVLLQITKMWIEEDDMGRQNFDAALGDFEQGIKAQLGEVTVFGEGIDRAVHPCMEEVSLLVDAFEKYKHL
jgi:hypothetical protein